MKFDALINLAPALLAANTVVHMKSTPGLGKSSVAKQIAKKHLGGRVLVPLVTNMTPMDVPGYIVPGQDDAGRDRAITLMPHWTEFEDGSCLWDYDTGMILVDEFEQGETEVKKPWATVILDRMVGTRKLPPGWRIWMASNNMSDRSGTTRSLDHIINRTMQVQISPDVESLINWMLTNGKAELFRAYVRRRDQKVFGKAPAEQGPWMTPRALMAAIDFLQVLSKDGVTYPTDDMFVQEIVGGYVGDNNAADLLAFMALRPQLPETQDILDNPGGAKLPTGMDAQMIVVEGLSGIVTTENADPIIAYMRRLPEELATTFVKGAVKKGPALLKTKAFTKWIADNQSLIAAMASLNSY